MLFAVAPAMSAALDREPSVRVSIDYSLDDNNFFDTQQKRTLLQQAAALRVTYWVTRGGNGGRVNGRKNGF